VKYTVGEKHKAFRIIQTTEQNGVYDADDDDIDDRGGPDAWPQEKAVGVRPQARNRQNQRQQKVGLDGEKAEIANERRDQRIAFR